MESQANVNVNPWKSASVAAEQSEKSSATRSAEESALSTETEEFTATLTEVEEGPTSSASISISVLLPVIPDIPDPQNS